MARPALYTGMWEHVLSYHERPKICNSKMDLDRGNGFYYAVINKDNHFIGFVQANNITGAKFQAKEMCDDFKIFGKGICKCKKVNED